MTVCTFFHPGRIMKFVGMQIPDNGFMCRTQFHTESIGITMIRITSIPLVNTIFVSSSHFCMLQCKLIKMTVICLLHRPFLSLIQQNHTCRSRCKRAESHTVNSLVCPQPFIRIKNLPRIKTVFIHNRPPLYTFDRFFSKIFLFISTIPY